MIHEHDALELASAAIDFVLSPAETQRLSEAVADCPVCAERAMAYRRHMRLLADLPQLEASDATRRRVMGAAATGRVVDTRTPMLLLAAALLLGALLAVAIVGGAFNNSAPRELPPLDVAVTSPSATLDSASPDPVASVLPGDGKGSTRTPLPPDTIADVVSNNLRIRSAPRVAADSVKLEPLLKVGDRLFVIKGPIVADDYDWYEVAAWRPSSASVAFPLGWVSRADHDGTTWIQAATRGCPSAPTLDTVVAMNGYEALACFGRRTLQLRAFVVDGGTADACLVDQGVPRCIAGPTWLAGVGSRSGFVDAVAATATPAPGPLRLGIDPTGPVTGADLPPGRMSAIEGAFDHAEAAACTFAGQPSAGVTADEAVLRCRATFVLSRATPDGNFLVPQTAAVTTTDGVRVRSRPLVDDTSVKLNPLLNSGTRLFVLQGPVAGSGYDWYQVVAPGISRVGGGPMVGWIAVAAKTGQPWAKAVPLDCPAPDALVSLADMARLASGAFPDGGLSCFADKTITTRGNLHLGCGPSRATPAPNWLSQSSPVSFVLTDGAATFAGRVRPEDVQAFCNLPQDANWNVEGHFGDPDSAFCVAPSAADPAALAARYQCRSLFVVTLLLRNG